MNKPIIAMLIVSQLAAAPVGAATLERADAVHARAGAFAGARLRVTLGGGDKNRVHAGLSFAPTRLAVMQDGRAATAIGEGIEWGVREGMTPGLSLAGRRVTGRKFGADQDKDDKGGIPTWALVVGGVVVVLGIGFAVGLDALRDQSE